MIMGGRVAIVGGRTNPFENYAQVKLDHLTRDRGENNTCLKPPATVNIYKT